MNLNNKFEEAINLHKSGKFSEAKAIYHQLYDILTDDTYLLFLMSALYYDIKDYDKALEYAEEGINISPQKELFEIMGKACVEKKDFDKAIYCYSKIIELEPDNAEILYNTAKIYYMAKKIYKAAELYILAVKLEPLYKRPFESIGNIFY
jgi:tetratricopeptide (TPR) repeat protein